MQSQGSGRIALVLTLIVFLVAIFVFIVGILIVADILEDEDPSAMIATLVAATVEAQDSIPQQSANVISPTITTVSAQQETPTKTPRSTNTPSITSTPRPQIEVANATFLRQIAFAENRTGLGFVDVEFHPNGEWLLVVESAHVTIVNIADLAVIQELNWSVNGSGCDNCLTHGAFSPEGEFLVFIDRNLIQLWKLDNSTWVFDRTLGSHGNNVTSIHFSPDGTMFASVDQNGGRLWEVGTGIELDVFDNVREMAFSSDSTQLFLTYGSVEVWVWDIAARTGAPFYDCRDDECRPQLHNMMVFANGEWMAIADWRSNEIMFLNLSEKYNNGFTNLDQNFIADFTLSPDESIMAVGADDLLLLEVDKGRRLLTLANHQERIRAVDFSPDGELLASVDRYGFRLWAVYGYVAP